MQCKVIYAVTRNIEGLALNGKICREEVICELSFKSPTMVGRMMAPRRCACLNPVKINIKAMGTLKM